MPDSERVQAALRAAEHAFSDYRNAIKRGADEDTISTIRVRARGAAFRALRFMKKKANNYTVS